MPCDLDSMYSFFGHPAFTVIGAIVSVATFIGLIFYGTRRFWNVAIKGSWEWVKVRIARAVWEVPKKTLIVLPLHQRQMSWSAAAVGANPAMMVRGNFYLTNMTDEPVLVPKTFLLAYYRKYLIPLSTRVEGDVLIQGQSGAFGDHPIAPRSTSEATAHWLVVPRLKKRGKSLKGTICFVDHFGNEHWTPVFEWRSP